MQPTTLQQHYNLFARFEGIPACKKHQVLNSQDPTQLSLFWRGNVPDKHLAHSNKWLINLQHIYDQANTCIDKSTFKELYIWWLEARPVSPHVAVYVVLEDIDSITSLAEVIRNIVQLCWQRYQTSPLYSLESHVAPYMDQIVLNNLMGFYENYRLQLKHPLRDPKLNTYPDVEMEFIWCEPFKAPPIPSPESIGINLITGIVI